MGLSIAFCPQKAIFFALFTANNGWIWNNPLNNHVFFVFLCCYNWLPTRWSTLVGFFMHRNKEIN